MFWRQKIFRVLSSGVGLRLNDVRGVEVTQPSSK